MKRLPVLAALLLLAGCSSGGSSDYQQYFQAVREGFRTSFGNGHATKAQAAAIPYASLGYRLNDGPEQIIVLATDVNGDQLWTSGAHIVIVTRDGRIVRTVGLPHDVGALTPQKGQHLSPPASALQTPVHDTRLMDLPDLPAYGVPLLCTAAYRGAQTITVLGTGISTFRIDEICRSINLDWTFTDTYWLDAESGMAWRSIQYLNPKGEKVETEILRPPG